MSNTPNHVRKKKKENFSRGQKTYKSKVTCRIRERYSIGIPLTTTGPVKTMLVWVVARTILLTTTPTESDSVVLTRTRYIKSKGTTRVPDFKNQRHPGLLFLGRRVRNYEGVLRGGKRVETVHLRRPHHSLTLRLEKK